MSRIISCALFVGALTLSCCASRAQAGGQPIQAQQGVRFTAKGASLAPRVVPLSEVLPFRTQRSYPRFYYVYR